MKEIGVLVMMHSVSHFSKALSRFKRAIFVSTVLFVVSISLSTSGLCSSSNDKPSSRKIGPLLKKTVDEHKKARAEKGVSTEASETYQIPAQLHKAIVVINRDPLKSLEPEVIEELKKRVEQYGGYIGNHAYNNVQVWLPLAEIENLAEWSEILRIDEPLIPHTHDIESQGTSLIGATIANSRGLRGKGIKVGVIDLGFKNYASLLGTELPTSVTTKVMGTNADFTSNIHGTACAEIVHDVAPEAELFLVNAGDYNVDFHNAVSWLQSQGVHVISSSIGINSKYLTQIMYVALSYNVPNYAIEQLGYLEQLKSQWDNTINNIVANGVTWSQAAGNDGQKKWKGYFVDNDGDYFLNFTPTEDRNKIDVSGALPGDEVYILLMWSPDTNFSTSDDFNLYIADDERIVCFSEIKQSLFPFGMEACRFAVDPTRNYYAGVYQYWTQLHPPELVLLLGHDQFPAFENYTPAKTVNQTPPANNPNVITVGAVPYYSPSMIQPYSCQGPNENGVIKPDIVAPDCVSTASGPFFCGTSAAAPHVAGLAALVKEAYPTWSPSQIKSYLGSKASDLGQYGKDNVFGSGLANISTLIPDSDGDGLTNEEEYARGTNPNNPDSDGDGMPDGWEVTYGLDPLANDASGDKDGDGYTNLKEYKAKTNPANPASKPSAMPWLPLLLDD